MWIQSYLVSQTFSFFFFFVIIMDARDFLRSLFFSFIINIGIYLNFIILLSWLEAIFSFLFALSYNDSLNHINSYLLITLKQSLHGYIVIQLSNLFILIINWKYSVNMISLLCWKKCKNNKRSRKVKG